jgi:hypothetical protein
MISSSVPQWRVQNLKDEYPEINYLKSKYVACIMYYTVVPVLRRRRSFRKKQPSAEAVCVRWSKVPLHEASVLQTDLKIE